MVANPDLSIIVPIFNEEECIQILYAYLQEICTRMNYKFEIIFVEDGSTDSTYSLLSRIHQEDPKVKIIKFRKNYGQAAAMAAGFRAARGEIVVCMDGDLQNDPADIPLLLAKLEEGYDIVCGWRRSRKDKLISRRIPSVIANWLIGLITGIKIHDNGCSLKAFRKTVIKNVTLYSEMHRFIPAMASLTGARITEIVVNHHPRRIGKSKYGLGRIWRVVLDIATVKMITGFISRPSLWFGILSVPFIIIGLFALVFSAGFYLGQFEEEWLVVSTVALLSLFLGIHVLSMGMIGEHIVLTGDYLPNKTLTPTVKIE